MPLKSPRQLSDDLPSFPFGCHPLLAISLSPDITRISLRARVRVGQIRYFEFLDYFTLTYAGWLSYPNLALASDGCSRHNFPLFGERRLLRINFFVRIRIPWLCCRES